MIECISAALGCSDIKWEDPVSVCTDVDCVQVRHQLGKGLIIHFFFFFWCQLDKARGPDLGRSSQQVYIFEVN